MPHVSDPTDDADPTDGIGGRAIRLAIVDDDALVRAGLVIMLDGDNGIEVVAHAADGDEVEAMVATHRPDVILMDIRMPRLDGIAATRQVRARPSAPQVIVLTTFDTDQDILHALRAGASGSCSKTLHWPRSPTPSAKSPPAKQCSPEPSPAD